MNFQNVGSKWMCMGVSGVNIITSASTSNKVGSNRRCMGVCGVNAVTFASTFNCGVKLDVRGDQYCHVDINFQLYGVDLEVYGCV